MMINYLNQPQKSYSIIMQKCVKESKFNIFFEYNISTFDIHQNQHIKINVYLCLNAKPQLKNPTII